MKPNYKLASADIINSTVRWRLWTRTGWQEVKRRYRRTVLGPFWLTFSLGIFIGGMGLIWAPLFNTSAAGYLPFVTTGMICWTLIATIINEGCATYTIAEALIKQLNFALPTLNLILVWRNIIVLFHNLLIGLIVFLVLPMKASWNMLLFFPGLLLVAVNGVWVSMLLGMVCARYRDVPQLVGNLVQVMMFVTPVFWFSHQLGARAKLMDFNPLYHVINIIRAPLLGEAPSQLNYEVSFGLAVMGWFITFLLYARFRKRIAYWV